MISKTRFGIILAVATIFVAFPANTFAADAQQNKIKRYTVQLKRLPEQAAPSSRINSLVKKLTQLQPVKGGQYYSIGLRKLGTTGLAGGAFARQLKNSVERILRNSGLSSKAVAAAIRRINKTQRL